MKKVLKLTRALLFNQRMEKPAQQRKNRMYQFFGILAVLCIIVPSCLIVGFLTYLMTEALTEAGGNEQGLLFVMHFMAIFALVFGFQVVLSAFYFASDLEHLIPLPIKISEIISVKFLQTYLAESAMEFTILLAAFVGYIAAAGISPANVLMALIGTITLPLIPLLYCGIISILLMYLTRFIRTQKHVSFLVWGLSGVLMLFAVWAVGGVDGLMVDTFVSGMVEQQNRFMKIMNSLFFHNTLLARAVSQRSLLALGVYLLTNGFMLLLFFLLAEKFYLPGLHRMASAGNKRRAPSQAAFLKACRPQRAEVSYLKKELRTLTRTGSYVTNCIMMTYVWPVAIGGVLWWKGGGETLLKYRQFYALQKGGIDILFLLCILLLSVLIPGANSVAATSFTREGAQIGFMKYIPLPLEKQVVVKCVASIMLGLSSSFLCVTMLCAYFRVGIVKTIYMLCISFLCCVSVTALGVWLDSEHPRLVWEDEASAMRGNLNVFFHMAFAILYGAMLCIIAYVLYVPTRTGGIVMHIFFLMLMLLISYGAGVLGLKKAVANLREIGL